MTALVSDECAMQNSELTYWKNYQTAMSWMKGHEPPVVHEEAEEAADEEALEFTIDDDLLDFYRLSREHKANRSE